MHSSKVRVIRIDEAHTIYDSVGSNPVLEVTAGFDPVISGVSAITFLVAPEYHPKVGDELTITIDGLTTSA